MLTMLTKLTKLIMLTTALDHILPTLPQALPQTLLHSVLRRGAFVAVFAAILVLVLTLASSCASSVRFTSAGGADYTMLAARKTSSGAASKPRLSSASPASSASPSATAFPNTSSDLLQESEAVFWGGASYYGDEFHGRRTANGEFYNRTEFSAAHRTLPFGTMVKVKNLANERTVLVRINDRGPFKPERVIDLSRAAAEELGMVQSGTANVEIVVMQ
jgi:rare lipoprotein A